MKISDLERMLRSIRKEEGDLDVLVGENRIQGLYIIPKRGKTKKALSIVPRPDSIPNTQDSE